MYDEINKLITTITWFSCVQTSHETVSLIIYRAGCQCPIRARRRFVWSANYIVQVLVFFRVQLVGDLEGAPHINIRDIPQDLADYFVWNGAGQADHYISFINTVWINTV